MRVGLVGFAGSGKSTLFELLTGTASDPGKGFIRAEVTAYDDLHAAGTLKEAKAKHLQRLEGKEYLVKDGDIIYFRSAV